jgi:hypothetical protein
MGKDDTTPHLNGWQKRDIVEDTLKTGDASKAQNVLNTVEDQKLFMTLLASKASEDHGLGHVQITDGKDGSPLAVKTDKLVVTRETGPDGEHLVAHGIDIRSRIGEAWNGATARLATTFKPITDSAHEVGDALRNAGTSKSLVNQGIDRPVEKAEGVTPKPPPTKNDG